jgi:hypothetical protein
MARTGEREGGMVKGRGWVTRGMYPLHVHGARKLCLRSQEAHQYCLSSSWGGGGCPPSQYNFKGHWSHGLELLTR